ncbi:hypothetical protein [Chlorogloeopsis sp. ULAP02]
MDTRSHSQVVTTLVLATFNYIFVIIASWLASMTIVKLECFSV